MKFGNIAANITERVDDPSAAGVDRYVGLEHLDPESTSIRRWGSPSDVESTKLRFYPGDVIYGRRRAYQRKLGVADFDGICSAHALVLRAKPDVCLPEFLPYFLQSDVFHQRALDISVGSLSPTINWKTLAVQEFALPPIKEQPKIVELLGATDTLVSRLRRSIGLIGGVEAAMVAQVARIEGAPELILQNCCAAPISYGIVQPGLDTPGGVPYVNVEDMTAGPLSLAALPRTSSAISARHGRTLLQPGDVLVALRGPIGLTAVISEDLAGANLSRGVARLHPTPGVDGTYLALCLSSPQFRAQIRAAATGSTFKELKIGALRQLRVPVPDLDRQREIAESVGRVRQVQAATADQIASTVHLRQTLLGKLLQGVADVQ